MQMLVEECRHRETRDNHTGYLLEVVGCPQLSDVETVTSDSASTDGECVGSSPSLFLPYLWPPLWVVVGSDAPPSLCPPARNGWQTGQYAGGGSTSGALGTRSPPFTLIV